MFFKIGILKISQYSELKAVSNTGVFFEKFLSQNARIVIYAIGVYLFLKNWFILQHISACSVKINLSTAVIDETRLPP